MIKPIPPATPNNVLPPNLDHEYFKDGGRHPFQPHATSFELVNAWWLAEAALLTYANHEFARRQWQAAGWSLDADQPFAGPSTLCYVAQSTDAVIVAFRGTEVVKPGAPTTLAALRGVLADFLTDGRFGLVDVPGRGAVHQGFQQAIDQIWPDKLLPRLAKLRTDHPQKSIWFTGHSLGAALATLAADRFRDVRGVYTFGSPLVGDGAFAQGFAAKAFRFVNNTDIVARVPPVGLGVAAPFRPRAYEHVGELKFFAQDGQMHDGSSRSGPFDDFSGVLGSVFNLAGQLRSGWLQLSPDAAFNDHAPLFYALRVWNAFASRQQ